VEKRCPRCGAVFPANARFCDLDGAELVSGAAKPGAPQSTLPAEARRASRKIQGKTPRRKLLLAAACLLLLIAGAALPSLAERFLRLTVHVDLVEVRLPGMEQVDASSSSGILAKLAGMAQTLVGEGAMNVRLELHNSSPLHISLLSANYRVKVDGKEVATGVWVPEQPPQPFPAGDEVLIDLAMRPDPASAVDISSAVLHGRKPTVGVHGDLTFELLWTTLTLPFEVRGTDVKLGPAGEKG
jgi:hypothetical protein